MTKSKVVLLSLLISLALNLFFIGGILYRISDFREFGPRPMPPNVSWIIRDLDESRQVELAPLLEQGRSDANTLRRQMFTAQRQVDELMTSPSFDPQALNLAFAELRTHSLKYQELTHQQMLQILGELNAEERAAAREFKRRRGPRDSFRRNGERPPGSSFDELRPRPSPPEPD